MAIYPLCQFSSIGGINAAGLEPLLQMGRPVGHLHGYEGPRIENSFYTLYTGRCPPHNPVEWVRNGQRTKADAERIEGIGGGG